MEKNKFGFQGSSLILWHQKISITWIILALVGVVFIYIAIGYSMENENLKKNGITTTAIVTDAHRASGKGPTKCTYTFEVNNVSYTGTVDDNYKKGDTILVIYLETKPDVNRDKKFFDEVTQ